MVDYEIILAAVAVSSFVLVWLKFSLLENIKKKIVPITTEIQEKMIKLLKSYDKKIGNDKNNFILDLVGMYHLERRLKTSEREFRNIVYGFIGIIFSSVVYAFAGTASLPIIFLIDEFSFMPIILGFGSLYTTVKLIEKYEDNALPR